MDSAEFLCPSGAIIEGEFHELNATLAGEQRFLVATRQSGTVRAWINICPHQGRPLNWAPGRFLSDNHGNLVCSAHGAVFEPLEGRCIDGPCQNACLTPVPVSEQDDRVWLDPA